MTNRGFQYFSLIIIFLHLNKKVDEDFMEDNNSWVI